MGEHLAERKLIDVTAVALQVMASQHYRYNLHLQIVLQFS